MQWNLMIEDPSGETRTINLEELIETRHQIIGGRGKDFPIPIRDATLPKKIFTLRYIQNEEDEKGLNPTTPHSPFWIAFEEKVNSARIHDFELKESELPVDHIITIGETRIRLAFSEDENALYPEVPSGIPPWKTCSDVGRNTLWMTKKAAITPLPIYISGETGTGKEVLARLSHAWSERRDRPFVAINCGALTTSLAESELFGHVKGAFTGAHRQRPGAFLQAHGGTLFLDEIGDLSPEIQVKLLRFLENGEIRPVGSERTSHADIRLICATHKPLEQMVLDGVFRQDLFYRVSSIAIHIPPLRTRPEDIEMLSKSFAEKLDRNLSTRAVYRLQGHSWPGNVRELLHCVEKATALAGPFTKTLTDEAFDFLLNPGRLISNQETDLPIPLLTIKEMERYMIIKALRISRGHRTNAARILGIARSTLFQMLKRHKIPGPKQAA